MTKLTYAGATYTREVLDVIYEESQQQSLPFDLQLCLADGESGVNEWAEAVITDPPPGQQAEASYGTYQVNTLAHGGDRDQWCGIEGTRRAMRLMAGRWHDAFERAGGWPGWQRNRCLFLQRFWPAAQGSIEPSWERVVEVEGRATLLALYYLELRYNDVAAALAVARKQLEDGMATDPEVEARLTALHRTDERVEVRLRALENSVADLGAGNDAQELWAAIGNMQTDARTSQQTNAQAIARIEGRLTDIEDAIVEGAEPITSPRSFFSRFASRKFLLAVFGAPLALLAAKVGVPAEALAGGIALLVAGILGIAYEDGKRATP